MYSSVTALIDRLGNEQSDKIIYNQEDMKVAAAVLLYGLIHADGRIRPQELTRYRDIIDNHFGISEDEFEIFSATVKNKSKEYHSIEAVTDLLKKAPLEEKRKIVAYMNQISISDNELHESELNMVSWVSDLLEIPPLKT